MCLCSYCLACIFKSHKLCISHTHIHTQTQTYTSAHTHHQEWAALIDRDHGSDGQRLHVKGITEQPSWQAWAAPTGRGNSSRAACIGRVSPQKSPRLCSVDWARHVRTCRRLISPATLVNFDPVPFRDRWKAPSPVMPSHRNNPFLIPWTRVNSLK